MPCNSIYCCLYCTCLDILPTCHGPFVVHGICVLYVQPFTVWILLHCHDITHHTHSHICSASLHTQSPPPHSAYLAFHSPQPLPHLIPPWIPCTILIITCLGSQFYLTPIYLLLVLPTPFNYLTHCCSLIHTLPSLPWPACLLPTLLGYITFTSPQCLPTHCTLCCLVFGGG